jgi:hypothetical protein
MLKKKNNLFILTFFILNFYFLFYQIVIYKEINISNYILIVLVIFFSVFYFYRPKRVFLRGLAYVLSTSLAIYSFQIFSGTHNDIYWKIFTLINACYLYLVFLESKKLIV